MSQVKMSRSEWSKTPYAGSQAQRTEDNVGSLLSKYNVTGFQWTQGRGPQGRPAIMFRFELQEKTYRIAIETLLAGASPDELMTQAKRAIYYYLKSALEMASVFLPMEKALFAFLELPDGSTCFEAASPVLDHLNTDAFAKMFAPTPVRRLLTHDDEVIEGEVNH